MSADILTFPGRPEAAARDAQDAEADRNTALLIASDMDELAAELGTPGEWAESAFTYLKARTNFGADGAVKVSVAALHLVLGHVEDLEQRLGLHGPGGAV